MTKAADQTLNTSKQKTQASSLTNHLNSTKPLRIGITVGAEHNKPPSIWASGAWQNVVFLYYLLRNSDKIASVELVNYALQPASHLDIGHNVKLPLKQQADVVGKLDVLIVMGIQIGAEATLAYKQAGAKIVAFHVGNHYIITLENILFNLERGGGEFDGSSLDAVWTLPHHMNTCKDFFEITNKAPCIEMPYLWSPLFIESMIQNNHLKDKFGYDKKVRQAGEKQSLAVFEPNMNVVKSSIYPMLIAERAYAKAKEHIKSIHITNTAKFHQQKSFNQFAFTLDITKKGIASYDDRYDTPSFMSLYGDIVISHQQENGLNNAYYDLFYGNYPLIHNSPFLKDVGYYYEGFNTHAASDQVVQALTNHNHEAYSKQCKKALEKVDLDNVSNIKAYEDALFDVLKT